MTSITTASKGATRWEISRLRGFSDAVFALAATLLVVTLEVPKSYDELLTAVAGFPAFAVGFMIIISLWYGHRQFFAECPLGDGWTIALNSLLLFIVLLYVYPLKLLTQVIAELFFGVEADVTVGMGLPEIQGLYLIYGAAAFAVFAVFTALHVRAWQLRDELALGELDRFELRQGAILSATQNLIAALSMLTAALGLGLSWSLPLWVNLLSVVVVVVERRLTARRRQELQAARRERRTSPAKRRIVRNMHPLRRG